MLLRQLKYFVTVVEEGSFTEAAERCYISQSAISQQIQALERDLGVELLHRANRKFTLTAAGEHFYKKGLVLLKDAETLWRETVEAARADTPRLRIGYLKCYSGLEFQMAVAEFTQHRPDVSVEIINGSHEDLYDALRFGGVDVILSDQRRAFSDTYVNEILTTSACYIEINQRHPLALRESLTADDLKDFPCILVATQAQRDTEQAYYRDVVGLGGAFLFADNLEEARLLVVGGKGYLPVEGLPRTHAMAAPFHRIPLLRDGKPILRNYCAFWKVSNPNPDIPAFYQVLKGQFPSEP